MRTWAYIDGFNLYYGALRGTHFKWLNLKALIEQLVPLGHRVEKVKYFTARVSGAVDPDAPRRQAIYLSALATIPEVEIYFGSFLSKTAWRPVVNLPVAARPILTTPPVTIAAGTFAVDGARRQSLVVGNYPARGRRKRRKPPRPLPDALITEVHTMEEKGSDVNLASHLLNDAWKAQYDAAVVVSNDTDLVEPIRMVTVERGKPVFITCPGRWPAAPKLTAVGTHQRHIRPSMLAQAQLPSPIPGTAISKPNVW